jgi:hypothetical protein
VLGNLQLSLALIQVLPIHSLIALMEAARTSETSVDIQLRTRQYIPEDSELFTYSVHIYELATVYPISQGSSVFPCEYNPLKPKLV